MEPEVGVSACELGLAGDLLATEESEEESEPPNIQDELDRFRNEWRQELWSRNCSAKCYNGNDLPAEMQSDSTVEEKASYWFMQGVNCEQNGMLNEAISYYRRAVQLVPDIEFRLADFQQVKKKRRSRQESESSVDSVGLVEEDPDEDDDLDNLIGRFQRLTAKDTAICVHNMETNACHFSNLPVELMMYILRWVVSTHLDIASLESIASVCRGFYLCARDEELWRVICQSIWHLNVGRPRAYGTWRNMYIERPHLRFNGCYLSKMSYYRHGERGLDNFYKPFMKVEYYRYVRFFPEGTMFMFTSPDDPYTIIPTMKNQEIKTQGILHGYYRMTGSMVTAVLKRQEVQAQSIYRYQRQRQQQNQNDKEQTFHVEFEVTKRGKKPSFQLNWMHYAVHTRYSASEQENVAEFELKNDTYPPLFFSRVKSYTSVTEAPIM